MPRNMGYGKSSKKAASKSKRKGRASKASAKSKGRKVR